MIILHLTDTHLVGDGLCIGKVDTSSFLKSAMDAVLAWPFKPDAVIHTGDISDDGSVRSYETFKAEVARLGVPVFAVPGNHDDRDAMRKVLRPGQPHLAEEGFLHYTARLGALDLIGLDTLDHGAAGRLCPERLAFAERALRASAGRPTVLFMHHPPLAVGMPFMDRIACAGAEALAPMIEAHGAVQVVLAGHAHRTLTTRFAGVPFMLSASPAHQFALAIGDDRPVGFVMEPPSCLVHVWLEDAARLVSHVVPLGDYGPVHPFPSN
ncbi:phosphodiesterase [Marinivivus vitaminiproducens]|uniref:phosphodiesterase n=1 Tax=Marinivivus vitaminiproducens TaxID=3035935 RepID=UPI0027A4F0FE|nr:phosphodiesterase [Geminicoccaceae bacterium SCSIO 64248]